MQTEHSESAIEQATREYEEGTLRDVVAKRVRGVMGLLVRQLDAAEWEVALDLLRSGMPLFERNLRREVVEDRAKEIEMAEDTPARDGGESQ